MRFRWWQAALLAGMLAAGFLIGAPGAGGQSPDPDAPTPTPTPGPGAPPAFELTYGKLTFAGRVNPLLLPRPARDATKRRQVPLLTPGGVPPVATAPRATTIDIPPEPLAPPSLPSSFIGLDSTDNPAGLHPPDPQLAVGPNHVLEMVNITGRVFLKDGTVLSTFTLAPFFAVPSGWRDFDPKVIYDAASGRFYASYASFVDEGGSSNDFGRLHIAVSTTSNPLDPWNVYFRELQGGFPDYPGIGLTDDKVTISYNRFRINPNPPFGRYQGVQTLVIQKSELVAGDPSPAIMLTSPDTSLFTIRPAHSLTFVSTQYMASVDNATSSVIHLFQVTGTPAGGDVVIMNVANLFIGTLSNPPDAEQAETTALIATNDNRLLETVWRDGRLWASANAACTFEGDDETRSCLKLIEVDTTTNSVPQNILFGASGEYFYYPAIRTDSAGNLHTVFTRSSSSVLAEVRVAGRLSTDTPNDMTDSQLVRAGEIPYTAGSGARRWGDYMGAAVDPADPSCIWVVGEYAKNDGFVGWGTFIGATSFSGGCGGLDVVLMTDGTLTFGTLELSATADSSGDVQTVQVVTGLADIDLRTTLWTDVDMDAWALDDTTSGLNRVVWEFSTDGTNWTAFTAANLLSPAAQGLGDSAELDLFFRLTMPSEITSSKEHSATVAIVATSPG